MTVQLCREAVLQEAPRQITQEEGGGYFREQHLGNNCEMFGFTIQSQGLDQTLYSFSLPNILNYQVDFQFDLCNISSIKLYMYLKSISLSLPKIFTLS